MFVVSEISSNSECSDIGHAAREINIRRTKRWLKDLVHLLDMISTCIVVTWSFTINLLCSLSKCELKIIQKATMIFRIFSL